MHGSPFRENSETVSMLREPGQAAGWMLPHFQIALHTDVYQYSHLTVWVFPYCNMQSCWCTNRYILIDAGIDIHFIANMPISWYWAFSVRMPMRFSAPGRFHTGISWLLAIKPYEFTNIRAYKHMTLCQADHSNSHARACIRICICAYSCFQTWRARISRHAKSPLSREAASLWASRRFRDVPSQDDKEVHFVFSRCNELFADRTIPL